MGNIVVLSSAEFLFRFLPAFLAVYWITPRRYRNAVLFGASILFYASAEPVFVFVLLGLTIVNYLGGQAVYAANLTEKRGIHSPGVQRKRKKVLAGMVCLDAAVLILCKILALAVRPGLLPLGLSFYIFKMISYEADLYRKEIRQRPTFLSTAAYFTMFLQITEGPIMRYEDGFHKRGALRKCSRARFEDGLVYVVIGLGMKTLLADRVAILWNELAKIGYDSISTPLAWLGAYAYSMELYYDFWGYSLIAAGAGMMAGFDFVENFAHPYAANGVGDFYRRWHATLGSWFRDYIYIPLGGSRAGNAATLRNLFIVWVLTGLWHGGTLNFVLWGLSLFVFIALEKFVLRNVMQRSAVPGHFNVWVLIPLTWVVFAITDLDQLKLYFGRLFPFFGMGQTAVPGDFVHYLALFWPYLAAGVILTVPGVFRAIMRNRRHPLVVALLTVMFWGAVYFSVTTTGNRFLYLNF